MKHNKRFMVGMLVMVLALSMAIVGCDNGTTPSTSTNQYDATRPIVCLGDSLTAGMINNFDQPEKSWPALLQESVTVDVINAGISGDTTADAIVRLENDVLSKNPQIVLIALGGNDISGINYDNAETILNGIKNNLQTIINRVKGENRKLYLVNYLSESYVSKVGESIGYPPAAITQIYQAMTQIYSSLAASNNIALIDNVITAEMANSYISADGVHLNETGYEMFADNIFNGIEPFLLEHNLVKENTEQGGGTPGGEGDPKTLSITGITPALAAQGVHGYIKNNICLFTCVSCRA